MRGAWDCSRLAVWHDRPEIAGAAARSRIRSQRAPARRRSRRTPLLRGRTALLLRRQGQPAHGGNAAGEGRRSERQCLHVGYAVLPRVCSEQPRVRHAARTARRLPGRHFRRASPARRSGETLARRTRPPAGCAPAPCSPAARWPKISFGPQRAEAIRKSCALALERIDWPRTRRAMDVGRCGRPSPATPEWNAGWSAFGLCSTGPIRTLAHRAGRCCTPSWRGADESTCRSLNCCWTGGARVDIRDELLKSTPLGWACRWGRVHFVELLLSRARTRREGRRALGDADGLGGKDEARDVLEVLRRHLHR